VGSGDRKRSRFENPMGGAAAERRAAAGIGQDSEGETRSGELETGVFKQSPVAAGERKTSEAGSQEVRPWRERVTKKRATGEREEL